MGTELKYWAFLSYSHADKGWAKWLHRAIETYAVPKHLVGRVSNSGRIPRKLRPVFRDQDDLPVSTDLSATVRKALLDSRYLIVLCSPSAAESKWVNREIREFAAARGRENILCAIVGRAPGGGDTASAPDTDLFPAALMEGEDASEPLAADLRRGFDGKRHGKLKLIAGLLNTGLDELVQRDLQRRQYRLLGLTAASFAGMAVMAFLTFSAIDSQRDEALQKAQAEELVEFMLGDLSDQLKPAGRLDTMASLGERALQYYAALDPRDLNAEDRSRRARALQAIGEIEMLRGDVDTALGIFRDAFETTAEALAANPADTLGIFDHAQSVFWLGYIDLQHARLDQTEVAFTEYLRLSERLTELEPTNPKWQKELGFAHSALGILRFRQGRQASAVQSTTNARDIFKLVADTRPDDIDNLFNLANTYAWLADVEEGQGNLGVAFENRISQATILEDLRRRDPNNAIRDSGLIGSWRSLGRLWMARGNLGAAEIQFSRSVDLGKTLLKLDPAHTQWSEFTARSILAYADLLIWQGKLDEAEALIGEADKIAQWLTEQDPGVLDWQVRLTFLIESLQARIAAQSGLSTEALAASELLIANLSDLAVKHPDNGEIKSFLGVTHLRCGDLLASAGREAEAGSAWHKAVEVLGARAEDLSLEDRAWLALGYLRLNQTARAAALANELEEREYRHPVTGELRQRFEAEGTD